MTTSAIRAVVFDFDGVILESGDIKTQAFVELFAEHAEHLDAIRAHHLANLGVSRFKKFEWIYTNLLHRPFDDKEKARLGDAFSALVFKKVCEAPFVPGAREALAALADRGMPMVVASGTPQDELDRIVDTRGLRSFFREVHGTPAEKPAVLRRVMEHHACGPENVLFIGDGTSDHDAARAVGVKFLARRTPELAPYWTKCGAVCVDDLTTLVAHVS